METNYVVNASNLYKSYGSVMALKDVTLRLEKGKIYGFIGVNGAGKTTAIRMLAGLDFPDSGRVQLFGQEITEENCQVRKRVGFLVENPIFFDSLDARNNLIMQEKLYGVEGQVDLQELLERVGLKNVGKKPLKDFSMGMKQRLGIAMVLLHQPELLILDEPINGLDPVGVVDVRNLLKDLHQQGVTIFLSSHILSELHQLATDYFILHDGKVLAQMTAEQLSQQGDDLEAYYLKLIGGCHA